MFKKFIVLSALLVLSGCAGVNVDKFDDAKVKGSPFTQALVKEYKSFVRSEAHQYDWYDADHFANKGLRALNGENVDPENPNNWNIPNHKIAEMTNYYNRLDYMLDNGAKKSSPNQAAKAMAKFDCWVEQQEENWQPNDIAACRKEFMAAFADLEKSETALADKAKKYASSQPKKARASMAMKDTTPHSGDGTIYFAFGSSKLNAADIKEVKALAKRAGTDNPVIVTGHTDTAGTRAGNMALSHRRAMAVRNVLIKAGVPSKNIRVEARGEDDLAISTGDNVREARNRRAGVRIGGTPSHDRNIMY
ncbi:MAG: OmpA family protein [Alphaproteobacteria bacterium]|nr:MAG: OmpA family protein [Alphaproteobacteria bacterium]